MIIAPIILKLINILLGTLIVSLILALPLIILIMLMQKYDKYKKDRDKEVKEAERIIIRQNESITTNTEAIKVLKEIEQKYDYRNLKLADENRKLEQEIRDKKIELGLDVDPEVTLEQAEQILADYESMTVKELHEIAKALELKGYSRWKKDKLISMLPDMTMEQIEKLQ